MKKALFLSAYIIIITLGTLAVILVNNPPVRKTAKVHLQFEDCTTLTVPLNNVYISIQQGDTVDVMLYFICEDLHLVEIRDTTFGEVKEFPFELDVDRAIVTSIE